MVVRSNAECGPHRRPSMRRNSFLNCNPRTLRRSSRSGSREGNAEWPLACDRYLERATHWPESCWDGRSSETREGDSVRFRLSDVFLPSREELLLAWPGEAEVEGTIVEFSDSGSMPRTFAVVEVLRRQAVV